ncbi:MAG: hypothetical protein AMXMBFR33_66590 [Candidatus Xenobia bacterium]|jgi:hypothetical protein
MKFYEGDDRVALVEELGRPMRLGRWSELEVSDLDRCQAALREQNLERALEYLPHVFVGQAVMLKIAYEWVLRWLAFAPPEAVAPGNQTFEASLSEPEREVGQSILHILTPQPESVSGPMTRLEERFPWLGQGYAQVVEGARNGEWDNSHHECERLFRLHRLVHDLLFRHSWALMSQLPQPLVEQGLREVLTQSSFYEASWQQSEGMTAEEIAVMLAEHMRMHFSGPDGTGKVTIADQGESILLSFDPCGSGGAMRRRLGDQAVFANLPHSSPLTWGRAGEVPAYCAHCAVNELEAVRRRGHLVWATEFDPDASRPCGWRIFKDPARIPEAYYQRLGLRPPS